MEREFIPLNIGILRVLETGALAADRDVEAIVGRLAQAGHHLAARETVTDSKSLIREQITLWIGDRGIDVIVVIGGIDSTPTDPMLDALAPLVSRQFFGFGELFRAIIHEEAGTASIFSHAEAALCNSTYVILLPASGFTAAAVERLLIPQLDHRTKPRNLAMSLPRLAGVPQETMGGGETPPSSSLSSGRISTTARSQPTVKAENTSRIAVVPPSPPPPPKRATAQVTAVTDSIVRRPPTTPGIAPISAPPAAEPIVPAKPRNPFAEALKEAVEVRRTSSVVAQLPTLPAATPSPAKAELPTVDLAELATTNGAPQLSESTSGTINMDALLSAASTEELAEPVPASHVVAPRVTAPPPFVPRSPTAQLPIVATPAPPITARDTKDDDAREIAIAPPQERERGSPRMFVEGRRRRNRPPVAVVVLLVIAGLSAIAAGVVVYLSLRHRDPIVATPARPQQQQPVAITAPPDAAPPTVVPEHDVVVDAAAEIEMPPMAGPPVDAGALALRPPPANPARPIPAHDPVVPKDAGAAVPMHDDGCDEVSCVLEHYEKPCCAGFKPKEPDPVVKAGPTKLDRTMVGPAVESIKPLVIACGERASGVKGTVKIAVHVGPDGHVTLATVAESPDAALGACVSDAMQRAVFPATDAGGGFTYPFVF